MCRILLLCDIGTICNCRSSIVSREEFSDLVRRSIILIDNTRSWFSWPAIGETELPTIQLTWMLRRETEIMDVNIALDDMLSSVYMESLNYLRLSSQHPSQLDCRQ